MSVLKIKDQNNNWTQIPTIKGEKGDPFTYADFTPEQLEALKGKDGISPTVSVASDTSEDYRLSFTDETHTVTTPNLIPEAEKFLSAYPTDTASGAIASFSDGADDIPLKSCIVQVNPVQDLHGYDSPWSAGSGKNLLNNTATTTTHNGFTFTVNSDGTVTANGTATATARIILGTVTLTEGTYIVNGGVNGNAYVNVSTKVNAYEADAQFTVASGGETLTVAIYVANGTTVSNALFKPMIRLASVSDASYAPYENICPITGWTGCELQKTGKNLLPYPYLAKSSTTDGITWTINEDGTITVNGTASSNQYLWFYGVRPIPIPSWAKALAGKTVTVSAGNGSFVQQGNASMQMIFYGTPSLVIHERTATIPSDLSSYTGFGCVLFMGKGITVNTTVMPQIELGSTATPYEPYTGQTYPITFPTEAGTVYGGYIDPINGELVTCPYYASYNGETLTGEWISDRDKYVAGTTPTIGAQVVNIGAVGERYPLTPTEIKTLLGTNNIWANTGGTEVEYRADVTKYIDRKITEAVSALT